MQKLSDALSFGGILSPGEISLITSHFEPEKLKVGERFHRAGKVSKRIGFIDQGAIGVQASDATGTEVTTYFIRSNQFIFDIESFYNNRPSKVSLEAVMDTTIYFIMRSDWNDLNAQVPKLFILTKTLTELALLNKINDNDFLHFGSAKTKYIEFTKRYKDLALHIPLQYIASYLKITPQSFSRIRREIATGK